MNTVKLIESQSGSAMNRFDQRCYQLLQQIPRGKVTTYGEIARALGTRAWRAVGSAMARNKQLVVIPCHRVVRSDGAVGDYASGRDQKIRLLTEEGVSISNGKVSRLEDFLHRF
jgi:methylated-DNA-[protein]-cysteine S-methyltransferase